MPTGFTPCWPLLEVQSKDLYLIYCLWFLSLWLICLGISARRLHDHVLIQCAHTWGDIQNRVHRPCLCMCEWNRGSGWRACSSPGTTCGVALQEIELTVDVVVWLCIAAAEYVNQWVGYGDKFLFIFFFDVTGWTCCVGNMNHAIKL